MRDTAGSDYTARLKQRGGARWKRLLNVQAPYRWNLRRQQLGRTIDVGCGIGRNLVSLRQDSIGVDHNKTSVEMARAAGFAAMTVQEWRASGVGRSESFDGLLLAHVVEHMRFDEAVELVAEYLPALKPGGKVFFICPQERGYDSDETHVSWTTGEDLERLARECGLSPDKWRSFPGPRFLGRFFTYNEFTLLAHKPREATGRVHPGRVGRAD